MIPTDYHRQRSPVQDRPHAALDGRHIALDIIEYHVCVTTVGDPDSLEQPSILVDAR